MAGARCSNVRNWQIRAGEPVSPGQFAGRARPPIEPAPLIDAQGQHPRDPVWTLRQLASGLRVEGWRRNAPPQWHCVFNFHSLFLLCRASVSPRPVEPSYTICSTTPNQAARVALPKPANRCLRPANSGVSPHCSTRFEAGTRQIPPTWQPRLPGAPRIHPCWRAFGNIVSKPAARWPCRSRIGRVQPCRTKLRPSAFCLVRAVSGASLPGAKVGRSPSPKSAGSTMAGVTNVDRLVSTFPA